jgi:phosphatidylserine decarboxylase
VNFGAIRERVAVDTVRLAPKALVSEAIGWGARRTLPRPIRSRVYTAFARLVGAQLDEVELPLDEYPSFSSFFVRRLRPDARAIDADASVAVSPCDGTVAAAGVAEQGRVIQAKGHDYSLDDLLADAALASRFSGGAYLTIYLSPRDYHRVHAPLAGALARYVHVPGTRFPVNPTWAARIPRLFARNERVILELDSALGRVALVMVAAVGVGNIRLAADSVATDQFRGRTEPLTVALAEPHRVERGGELGAFELGSTVVVLFEPGRVELSPLEPGTPIRLGQAIGRVMAAPRGRSRNR